MRLLPALVFVPLIALLPASAAAGDARAAASSVREAERQRTQALNGRDIALLRRLIGGNYQHVETNGRLRTKTEFLQALARDEYRLRDYEVEDMDIEVVDDGDVAIVTGTWRATSQDASAALPLQPAQPIRGRYVRIWTRQPEGWRNALHQGTAIRPAAPPH